MADLYKKVSGMVSVSGLRSTDCIPIVSGGNNYKVSIATLLEVLGGGGGVTPKMSEIIYGDNLINISVSPITGQIGE